MSDSKKKYVVVCYAVHNTNIASYDTFDTYDEAVDFLDRDVKSVYEDELQESGNNEDEITYDGGNGKEWGAVIDMPADCQWTWDILAIDV